jgi:hypothetical protein
LDAASAGLSSFLPKRPPAAVAGLELSLAAPPKPPNAGFGPAADKPPNGLAGLAAVASSGFFSVFAAAAKRPTPGFLTSSGCLASSDLLLKLIPNGLELY